MQLWLWALNHLQGAKDAAGAKLFSSARQGVTFPLADALCWLLASRYQIIDVLKLEEAAAGGAIASEGLPGLINFLTDLCHVQAARASGEAGRICADLVYGYNRHPAWDQEGCGSCYASDDLEALEGTMPGISSAAAGFTDVLARGSLPLKAGPCARTEALESFIRLRMKLDGCLTGARLAKDRAADALTQVMIPEALGYPA
jgi:hypothetical protein